jgi:hypothetical protein
MVEKKEHLVAMCPMMGEGQHLLVVMTSEGRMFERRADPRPTNFDPLNPGQKYIWKEIKGPLDVS